MKIELNKAISICENAIERSARMGFKYGFGVGVLTTLFALYVVALMFMGK